MEIINIRYYDHFVIPFTIGVIVLFSVLIYKYVRWIVKLPARDHVRIRRSIFTAKSLGAVGEVVTESLFHRRIFRINPLLGYMHMSLALGWFLLIVMGWVEAAMHLTGSFVPIYAHVFFKFFAPTGDYRISAHVMGFIMDALLLFVLSGVALAWFKRLRSKALGLHRTTKHTLWDRVALTSLWFIFPVRLIAESAVSGLKGTSTFLTGNIGAWLTDTFGFGVVYNLSAVSWWIYSIVLAVFLISLPFSRYMHIFTEVPLIFLRKYGVKSSEHGTSFDHFQIEACSRCGICIDPCQLQKDAGIKNVQSVYFLRDRRYNRLTLNVASNCLMCGRCEEACPVGIQNNILRLSSRVQYCDVPSVDRYQYLPDAGPKAEHARIGFFAGCMTHLSPAIIRSMEKIFAAAGDHVWFADRDQSVCCGRPLKLSGEASAAARIMEYNNRLFESSGITTLVTPCPICFKVFNEDYRMGNIQVLHHSQYISRLIKTGKITIKDTGSTFVYHDPCELGRGGGIYEEPRHVLGSAGSLKEPEHYRTDSLCCGSSLANFALTEKKVDQIASNLACELESTGAERIATACPLCKKTISKFSSRPAVDIAEITAAALN